MPNNAMPYENSQKPAIPKQEQGTQEKASTGKQPNDHPNQLDKGAGTKQAFENGGNRGTQGASGGTNENEGEGSRSAARNYDAATEQYAKSGRVSDAAKRAESALDGPEGEELRAAEQRAKAESPKGNGPTAKPPEEGKSK